MTFNWNLDIWGIVRRVWILFKPSALAEFFWHFYGQGWEGPYFITVRGRQKFKFHTQLPLTFEGGPPSYFWVGMSIQASQWVFSENSLAGGCRSSSSLLPTWYPLTSQWRDIVKILYTGLFWHHTQWIWRPKLPNGLLWHHLVRVGIWDTLLQPNEGRNLSPYLGFADMDGVESPLFFCDVWLE